MTRTEIEQIITAIQRRGDPAYNTPSGCIFEHISTLAMQLDITALAESCEIYISFYPDAATFIAERVPGVLCNNYFTALPEFDYEKFTQWYVNKSDWDAAIKVGFFSASKLFAAIASIRHEVEQST